MENTSDIFKSGFVSLIGRPNVGKSTLMNALLGEKVAIISNKPQTTRTKITGVLTKEHCQIVFIDTPGIHRPKHKLGEHMVRAAQSGMGDADVVLYLVEPHEKIGRGDADILARLKKRGGTIFLIINKLDTVEKTQLLGVIDAYRSECAEGFEFAEVIPISAINGENLDRLMETVTNYLPQGPRYFPDDVLTDQPERVLAAELVREKLLHLLEDEIPHGIAVDITTFRPRETKNILDIEATIICERESHKGIVIGKGGSVLKETGKRARLDMERLFSQPVNLQLWVKVRKDWRDSDIHLRSFGYGKH
ncbi:MAG: GTPase Era [Defluviitaleaceae bacterium]|nr:GTPase Era [Defluviitaleaceae bacterium]